MAPTAGSDTSSTPSSFSILYEVVPKPYDSSSAISRFSSSSSSLDSDSSGRSTIDLENGVRAEVADEITPSSTTTPSVPTTLCASFLRKFDAVPKWIRTIIVVIGAGLAFLALAVLWIALMVLLGSWIIALVNAALGFFRTLGIMPNWSEETAEAASTVAEAVAQAKKAAVEG